MKKLRAALRCGLAALVLAACADLAAATPISISTATTAQLVAPAAGKAIRVTAFSFSAAGATTVQLVYGTQTTTPCDTGQVALTGAYDLAANTSAGAGAGSGILFIAPAGTQLCVVQTGAVNLGGFVTYSQS